MPREIACHIIEQKTQEDMRRIIRDRRLTRLEAKKYDTIREQIARELPVLLARHSERVSRNSADAQALPAGHDMWQIDFDRIAVPVDLAPVFARLNDWFVINRYTNPVFLKSVVSEMSPHADAGSINRALELLISHRQILRVYVACDPSGAVYHQQLPETLGTASPESVEIAFIPPPHTKSSGGS